MSTVVEDHTISLVVDQPLASQVVIDIGGVFSALILPPVVETQAIPCIGLPNFFRGQCLPRGVRVPGFVLFIA